MSRRQIAFVLTTVLATASASASVDMSPKPGGIYKLKPGTYVRAGVDCNSATIGSARLYDGHSIRPAHARSCSARVISRRGNRYYVEQACAGATAGAASERQVVTVSDALAFTLRTGGPGVSYRYCPSYMLPIGFSGGRR